MISFSSPTITSGSTTNPSSSSLSSSSEMAVDEAPSEPGDRNQTPRREPFSIANWMHQHHRRLAAAAAAQQSVRGGSGCTPSSWSSSSASSSFHQHAPEMDEGEASHIELVKQLRMQQEQRVVVVDDAQEHDHYDDDDDDDDDDHRPYSDSPHSLALSLEEDEEAEEDDDGDEFVVDRGTSPLPLCPITPSKLAPRPTKSCLVVRVPSPSSSAASAAAAVSDHEHEGHESSEALSDAETPREAIAQSPPPSQPPFRSDSCSSRSSVTSSSTHVDAYSSTHSAGAGCSSSSALVTPVSPTSPHHHHHSHSLDVRHLHLRLVGDEEATDASWRLHVSAAELEREFELELEDAEEYMIKGMLTRGSAPAAPAAAREDVTELAASEAAVGFVADDWVEIEACHWQWLRPGPNIAASADVCINRGDGRTVKRRVRVHFPSEAPESDGEVEGNGVGRLCSLYPTYSSVEYDRSPLEPPSAEERSCSLPERGSRRVQDDENESFAGSDVESDSREYADDHDDIVDDEECEEDLCKDNAGGAAADHVQAVDTPIVSDTTPSDDCWEDWLDRRKSCKPSPCRPEPCTPSSTPAASSTPTRSQSPVPAMFGRHIEVLSFQCPSPTTFGFSDLSLLPGDHLMLDAHQHRDEEESDTPSLASHTSTTTGTISELATEPSPTSILPPTILEPASSASSSGDEFNMSDSRTASLDVGLLGQSPVDERMATWLPHSRGRRSYETLTDASDAHTETLSSPLDEETLSPAESIDCKDTSLPPTFFAPKLKRKKRASSGSRSPSNTRSGSSDSDSRRSCWASALLSGCSSGFSSTAEDEGCLGGF